MKKIAVTAAVFLLAAVCSVGAVMLVQPEALSVRPITETSPCPVVGCASGSCHGFDDVPEPHAVHEITSPDATCATDDSHGCETLGSRYHQASDASLNLWILMPVVLVVALVGIARKVGRS